MSLAVTPHGVDPESLQEWKAAWIQLWADEKEDQKKKTVTIIIKRDSLWDTYERVVPWCPKHYDYCIIDETMSTVQNWKH